MAMYLQTTAHSDFVSFFHTMLKEMTSYHGNYLEFSVLGMMCAYALVLIYSVLALIPAFSSAHLPSFTMFLS